MAKKARVYTGTQWVELASSNTDLTNYAHIPSTQFGFRNKIINGDFRINQRGYTSASNLASGAYGFDRWKSTFTNTTLTFTSAPQGQMVTINSGGSIEQIIERENMPAGTYTLSWVGTATGRIYNTGSTPPSYAASPVLVTIDGTANVEVEFTASGGTRTLQNVQLETGSKASAFEYRPIGTELALCQRYYWQHAAQHYLPAVLDGGGAQYPGAYIIHPVPMRTTPVGSSLNIGTFYYNNAGEVGFTPTGGSGSYEGTNTSGKFVLGAISNGPGSTHSQKSGQWNLRLTFSAEL